MKISNPDIDLVCDERDIYTRLLPLENADILELGCGKAEKTLVIAKDGKARTIVALEVDEIQHAENLRCNAPANVRFQLERRRFRSPIVPLTWSSCSNRWTMCRWNRWMRQWPKSTAC